ncbi:MAG TPA: DUF423 domain-containing protein [Chitinophagaceae bacterium]|jgi:uncharacterized membrane protein YgdD (TMEM256/DUF423 family)|nr:DUF423 domain-containing protein [Chitinophagaceae bacterium]
MHKPFLTAGAILGGLAIALGAFGAHGLEKVTTDEKILHSFQTGVQYQMYHALALLAVGVLFEKFPVKWMQWAGNAFIIGTLLFSGSLYLLTFLKIQGSSTSIVGPITPLGGIVFILGWACLVIAVTKRNLRK